MLVTLIDVETTGLDPATDEMIEVAAVLYSVEHRAILQQVSTLLPVEANPAEAVNGISPYLSESLVLAWDARAFIAKAISEMMKASDYIVAFNADFDRAFVERASTLWTTATPWSDAAAIRYPKPSHKRDLVNLCVAHGIPVVSAHRAFDDCRLLAELLGKVPDLEAELARAARPKVLVKALVGYGDRQMAKDHGFHWNNPVPNAWTKRMPLEDAEELPFEVVEIVVG